MIFQKLGEVESFSDVRVVNYYEDRRVERLSHCDGDNDTRYHFFNWSH